MDQHHQKQLAEKQSQGLASMVGIKTVHVLYEDYYYILSNTRAENSQCTGLFGGNHTDKDNKVEK